MTMGLVCVHDPCRLVIFVLLCSWSSSMNFSLGFRPLSEAGAANVAALASGLLLGVSSPKGSWVGVNVAALASG